MNRADQERVRQQHAALKRRPLLPWPQAQRQSARDSTWSATERGDAVVHRQPAAWMSPLETIVPYIDWTFFFAAWELKGRFPAILDHPQYGAAARELYDHARTLLDRIVAERLLDRSRRVRLLARALRRRRHRRLRADRSAGSRSHRAAALQHAAAAGAAVAMAQPNLSLADFVAPRDSGTPGLSSARSRSPAASAPRSWPRRSSATRTTTTRSWSRRWPTGWPKPSPSGCTRARARDWGYGAGEQLSSEDLIAERYRGIRPAFGYPACPDHSEKCKLFELLQAERAGISLTESCAMAPAASVSGLYFAHPQARYFTVGRLGPRSGRELRRGARAISRRRRSNAGCGPTWAYD